LLVEDELLVSMTTADLLSDLGYDVAVAETGSEALRHLESDIDVLITDLGLPDMDGSALIAAARARQRGVAVVVATGRARQEAGGLGPLIWLNKPYDSEDLRQALDQAMSAAA
jgi:CheY-like chemotaxis protein